MEIKPKINSKGTTLSFTNQAILMECVWNFIGERTGFIAPRTINLLPKTLPKKGVTF